MKQNETDYGKYSKRIGKDAPFPLKVILSTFANLIIHWQIT